jgi:hypothetical protein
MNDTKVVEVVLRVIREALLISLVMFAVVICVLVVKA